jgi:ankyrin repeat protein
VFEALGDQMAEYPPIVKAVWTDNYAALQSMAEEPDTLDPDGRTALMAAAIDSKFEASRILIAAGAQLNIQDPGGWSALHFAAQSGSAEVVGQLLEAGASVDPIDSYGNTPLWRATMNSAPPEVINLLKSAGADVLKKNFSGFSPADINNGA